MSKKFNTFGGFTAGGGSYGYKSKAEAKRARAKSKALDKARHLMKKSNPGLADAAEGLMGLGIRQK